MSTVPLPHAPSRLEPLVRPVVAFLSAESAGGILLLAAAVLALAWANSPWGQVYHDLWHAEVAVGIGGFAHTMSVQHWVNDGLMVAFFLLVGLEIKRELLFGELASVRRASLPVAAAVGGMAAPALIFAALNAGGVGAAGWGVPMATDIAFAVGVVALVGRGLPTAAKVFLLAVAIVDDLGAVLVIAAFYTDRIAPGPLAAAGGFLAGLVLLNVLRVHRPLPYVLLGVGLWVATLASGVHATVAGVLLALTIPATRECEERPFVDYVRQMLAEFERGAAVVPDRITEDQSHALKAMERASQAVQTPLARVEHGLLWPVNFLVVPLFALANAGVDLRSGGAAAAGSPVAWGVLLGLLVGKPTGILVASWLAVRCGLASLPGGATWRQVGGLSVLCGIGFTMSLFVANLAFPGRPDLLAATKVGILIASLVSGAVGGTLVARACRRPAAVPVR
ncbi:MAG: Na+/H+ antiporter NhaA [Phycisphaerales bacterium]|nr:Na+/H+ antiporter NhaA [Phycisphaerales bacterium]